MKYVKRLGNSDNWKNRCHNKCLDLGAIPISTGTNTSKYLRLDYKRCGRCHVMIKPRFDLNGDSTRCPCCTCKLSLSTVTRWPGRGYYNRI